MFPFQRQLEQRGRLLSAGENGNMPLFKNTYRIESARRPNWNCAAPGWHFVTICTWHRQPFFGQVIEGQARLSLLGEIVAAEWQPTPAVRPNVALDAWVIMPDHVHGIIQFLAVETSRSDVPADPPDVSTAQRGTSPTSHRRLLRPGSLGAMIGQFKSRCTKRIWAAGHRGFAWQSRFHDIIVRDQRMLDNIRRYIAENPARWQK